MKYGISLLICVLAVVAGISIGWNWQLVLVVTVMPFLIVQFARLKMVAVDEEHLYVGNGLREIVVPLSAIKKVKISALAVPTVITIELEEKTSMGKQISFAPLNGSFSRWLPIAERERLAESLKVPSLESWIY
jgi:hypothetical protein